MSFFWPDQSISSPRFPRVSVLELYGSSLCVSDPQKLKPYLNDTLEELKIWSENDVFETPARSQGNGGWTSHLGTKCSDLTTLKLEFAIRVSSAELTTLFNNMPQLKTLRLGEQMNPVLNRDIISAVFRLPCLEDLSQEFELNLLFIHELVGTTTPGRILPRIVKLHVKFSVGNDVVSALLLHEIPNVEWLKVSFGSPTGDQVSALHPTFSALMTSLSQLTILELQLSPGIHLTHPDLVSITYNKSLNHLTISSSELGVPQDPVRVLFTANELANASFTLRYLEILECLELPSTIEATYEEAVIITHLVDTISPRYAGIFDLSVDETASFGWPATKDYQSIRAPSEMVWKANTRNFPPDAVQWTSRDINTFVNEKGEIVPPEQVVADGSYNHLT
jgi:hypothetical protein